MNQTERESVILNSAWEMIDRMANWTMFVENDLMGSITLQFQSSAHAEKFIILLTDFLSPFQSFKLNETEYELESVPNEARWVDRTFIIHLRQVCQDPQLGEDAAGLSEKVEGFASWLGTTMTSREVNLPSIDVVANIEVERYTYIKMCGNIAKHNRARLSRIIGDLRGLLAAAGHDVSLLEMSLAIEEFFDWFFDDMFIFHSNQIVEFLNDIRWHMFEYLQPEYEQSWFSRGRFQGDYGYHIPESITEPVAEAEYWDLMNRVRREPYMPQFTVVEALKGLHWSEVKVRDDE